MPSFKKQLERFFDASDELQDDFSHRWRHNANRRTIVVLIVTGIFVALAYLYGIQPPANFPTGELVNVPDGESLSQIAGELRAQGVIRSPIVFRVLVTFFGYEHGAHAGDYLFKQPENIWTVARAISIGAYGLEPYHIRIPEGATIKEMAAIYSAVLPRFNGDTFTALALPQEGYLFPDTYYFLPNATAQTVFQAMRQKFDDEEITIDPLIQASGHSLRDIVTMASILEREARLPDDRRMISGVLWNRLKRGMALQVDATFLYTIGKGSFQLTMKDLTTDSPYNTYTNKGLPPGPIGSPSLDALEAAAEPTQNTYLYYLADNNGVTHYAKTYQQHLQNKAKYLGT